jgi:hypothetical protein
LRAKPESDTVSIDAELMQMVVVATVVVILQSLKQRRRPRIKTRGFIFLLVLNDNPVTGGATRI